MTNRCECKRANGQLSVRDCSKEALETLAERNVIPVTPSRIADVCIAFTVQMINAGMVNVETLFALSNSVCVEVKSPAQLPLQYGYQLSQFQQANNYDIITALQRTSQLGLRFAEVMEYKDPLDMLDEQDREEEEKGKEQRRA